MLTKIQYSRTDGLPADVVISYNTDIANTIKEINIAGALILQNSYNAAGQLIHVDVCKGQKLLITADYIYAGNEITINQVIDNSGEFAKYIVRMFGQRQTKAILALKKNLRQLLTAHAATTIYSQVKLNNGAPVSFDVYYPSGTGDLVRTFWIDFTGNYNYDAYWLSDTVPTLYSSAVYGDFDDSPSSFTDRTFLLSMFAMSNCFMFAEIFFPEVLSIHPKNYATYNLKKNNTPEIFEQFKNTVIANQLTQRTLAAGTNPPITQINYTY